jgi:tryptophan 7-halogenase
MNPPGPEAGRPPAGLARGGVRRVVIAGGGTAGWMVAAGLAKSLGRLLEIRLVESDEIGTVGVGEATIPSLQTFHALLGIDERAFMAATQATFKLGIRFEHWRQPGEHYFHGFGLTGKDHWTAGFQHFWLKGRQRGLAADYGAYGLEVQAAAQGRFAHGAPRGGDDGLRYAYHLDATLYARFLRRFSEALGVQRIEGRIVEVEADAATADIRALRLDSGERIEGELFIDCTGFRALLIGETLKVGYEDWSHWLANDSAVAVQTASVRDAVPYTRSRAHGFGWQWCIPLQHRVGNGLVYSSRHASDAEARQALLAHIEGEPLTEPRVLRFRTGQRQQAWQGNCVAVGLSGGFLEPLESTSIYLIQRAIIRLVQLFPQAAVTAADVAEFNRQMRADFEHVRDFIILHYHVTDRQDTAYWQRCRSMDIPATLRHRIELFSQTGRVFRVDGELFAENSWVQVMLGQGIVPAQYHPVAELMDDAELGRFLNGIRAAVDRTVQALPAHQAYVMRHAPAPTR